jgi:hypothetical protein
MSQGFMGLHLPSAAITYHITFDPRFGVFWQSPVLLLSALGLYVAMSQRKKLPEAAVAAYSIGIMIAMNGGYYLWWGGSAFGPRLIIPALPFFIVPLALVPAGLTWLVGALGAVSCIHMLIPLLGQIQPTKLTYRAQRGGFFVAEAPFHGFSLLYDYGIPQIVRQQTQGQSPWNLASGLGLPFWLSVPALLCAEAILAMRFLKAARKAPHEAGLAGHTRRP